MKDDDIETVLLAKKNYKVFVISSIVTSILLLVGIGVLSASGTGTLPMFLILSFAMSHVLGSAGFITWRPVGKKLAPVPYYKLLWMLERQLYKDVDTIESIANIKRKT